MLQKLSMPCWSSFRGVSPNYEARKVHSLLAFSFLADADNLVENISTLCEPSLLVEGSAYTLIPVRRCSPSRSALPRSIKADRYPSLRDVETVGENRAVVIFAIYWFYSATKRLFIA